jgi:DNA-binding transcriptional MerR regulator
MGEVAVRAGVTVDTVRFYERERLLPSTGRTQGGFRLFQPETVDRIRFIKQAQNLGFALEEIRAMLRADGSAECHHVHDLMKAKLAEVASAVVLLVPPTAPLPGWALMTADLGLAALQVVGSLWIRKLSPSWEESS